MTNKTDPSRTCRDVQANNPAEGGYPPPGYMTPVEAYERLSRSFDDICRKYGVLHVTGHTRTSGGT